MGSSPSSGDKTLVGVEQIKTPQTQHKQNQQFKTSVQQMKFSKRNDIFKQKSDETKLQLRNALQNLKKNQLLSTGEFKKLHQTEQLIKAKHSKAQRPIKAERYEYRSGNKHSEQSLAIKKKSQLSSSKHISSVSSTHIHEYKDSIDVNESNLPTESSVPMTVEAQVISHLLNRKKNISSQNANRNYRNVLDNAESEVIVDFQMKYENGKSDQRKKKSKYIKSQKFIPHQLGRLNQEQIPEESFEKQAKVFE